MDSLVFADAHSVIRDTTVFAQEHVLPSKTRTGRLGFLRYFIGFMIIGFGVKPFVRNCGGKSNDKIEKERYSASKIYSFLIDFPSVRCFRTGGGVPVWSEGKVTDHGREGVFGRKGRRGRLPSLPTKRLMGSLCAFLSV